MNFFKQFLNFILFGNIFVAAGASCLVYSSGIQLHQQLNLSHYALLVFFATLFIYNFQRIFYSDKQDKSLNSIRRNWIFENQKTIIFLTIIGFIGVTTTFFFNDFRIVYYLSPLLLISLAYFVPVIKLRKYAWLKLFTLAIVWTTVTALVPALFNSDHHNLKEILLHISLRFCFMMAICIPFDIRDLEIDKAENISTLSLKFGLNKTRLIAISFIFCYFILMGLEFLFEMISGKIFFVLFISGIITAILVMMSKPKRSEYFFVAGLDGTMILQGVLLILVNYL